MTERTNDGGPAFPFGQVSEASGQPINGYHNDGMTLRDYFAAKAMQGLLSDQREGAVMSCLNMEQITLEAYAFADAMLAARESKPEGKTNAD